MRGRKDSGGEGREGLVKGVIEGKVPRLSAPPDKELLCVTVDNILFFTHVINVYLD